MVQELPLITAKNRDASTLIGTKDAVTLGLSSFAGAAVKAAELSPLLAEELLRHLHRKLHETTSAKSRAHWFGGRVYNWALGADLNNITMSGAHVRQVFLLFDLTLPPQIDPRDPYLLRADFARQAHDVLGARLGVAEDALAQGLE